MGAWSWGDRSGYWGWKAEDVPENKRAYEAAIKYGLDFIDTAEVYGFGESERLLGQFIKQTGTSPQIATKFAPLPWKQTPESLVQACRASLQRLDQKKVALYMQHWPGFFLNAFSNDAHLEGLAQCYEQGLCEAVGVSNFNAKRVRNAAKFLENRGTCLASNQVQYSLLYREPELKNGVMEACKESGTTLVAYSPICQGMLSGKYSAENPPTGPRKAFFTDSRFRDVAVLLDLLRKMSAEKNVTPAQIALNWTLCKGALPIPGAKTAKQVEELAGALGWRLTDGEVAELDSISKRIPSSSGAPFENW